MQCVVYSPRWCWEFEQGPIFGRSQAVGTWKKDDLWWLYFFSGSYREDGDVPGAWLLLYGPRQLLILQSQVLSIAKVSCTSNIDVGNSLSPYIAALDQEAFGAMQMLQFHSLGLQIAQSRPYLYTLGPKVGIIYIHGAPGIWMLRTPMPGRQPRPCPASWPRASKSKAVRRGSPVMRSMSGIFMSIYIYTYMYIYYKYVYLFHYTCVCVYICMYAYTHRYACAL